MKFLILKFPIFMHLIFALAFVGCVGDKKPTTNANCSSGFKFDPVSRSCFAAGEAPVATLSQVSVFENSGKNFINLTYKDGNNDFARSCRVENDSPSRIEISSPRVYELASRSVNLLTLVEGVYSITAPSGLALRDLARSATAVVRSSTTLAVAQSGKTDLINAARNLAAVAQGTGLPVAISAGNALLASTEDYESYFSTLGDRCHCEVGVCQSVLVPRTDIIGNAGFRYSVSDLSDGSSNLQNVTVNISAINKRPVARSGNFTFAESDSTVANTDFFVTPAALSSIFGTTYSLIDSVNFGSLDICAAGMTFFPGVCSYTPVNGDLSDTYDENGNLRPFVETGTTAEIVFDEIRYTAVFTGSAGNNIRIRYIAYQGLGFPAEGNVKLTSDAVGPIIEVTVVPGQTLRSVVANEVMFGSSNANLFVTAVDESAIGNQITLTGTANLVGGEDAQDTFRYQACNGMLCTEGGFTIRITETNDRPYVDTANITFVPTPILEDVPFVIEIPYLDPDSPLIADDCDIDPIVPTDYVLAACSCDAITFECTASLTTRQDFNGASTVRISVENDGLWSDWVNVILNITPVNDAPFIEPAPFTFADDSIDENDGVNVVAGTHIYQSPSLLFNRGDALTMMSENNQNLTMTVEITDFFGDPQDVIPMTTDFINIMFGATVLTPVDNNPLTPFVVPIPAGLSATTFTLQADKFKSTVAGQPLLVNVTIRDNGGVANGGVDTTVYTFELDVVNVDFPPTISPIATVQANEGGEVYSPQIFITEGGESDEAIQSIQVRVESDNPTLLPLENITLHYNKLGTGLPHASENIVPGPEPKIPIIGVFYDLNDGTDPSADFPLILRMKPVGGVTGTANITVFATDGSSTVSSTFPLVIHPISARHGGWNQIKAVSNKVFSATQLDPNRFCEEDTATTSCGTDSLNPSLCRNNTAPNSSINAQELHSLFFDFANNRCHFSTGAGVANWQELNTFCRITKKTSNPNCIGASCMGATTPIVAGILPTAVDQYYFDYSTRTCYRSEGLGSNDWVEYFPSQVTLGWNDFIMAGSGASTGVLINGWQVFRRSYNTPFDFSSPLVTLNSPSARSYTDTSVNENSLYYYVVRPIDNTARAIATATNDVFSEIRVMTPPRNMSFVHRWMVNQEVCGKMGKTMQNEMVEPENNFRCEFTGPGAVLDASNGNYYYDIGRDLFVDIAEAGCPFTPAPACTSNGCIAAGDPNALGIAAVGDNVFYNRSNGTCYRVETGAWVEISDITIDDTFADLSQNNLLPPLVNVTQANAVDLCRERTEIVSADLFNPISFQLPSRLEQIAYSAQPLNLSDTQVEQIERGLSLNSTSKCNGSAANGVSGNYTSGQIPPSSFYYTLPGTSSSGIRSVVTGSILMGDFQSTQACVSRYGVQDVYGNVAEWVSETMDCSGGVCLGNLPSNFDIEFMSPFLGFNEYGFDGEIGPCRDVNANGICDSSLTSWLIQDKNFNAGFFSFPMGLPINRNFVFNYPTDPIAMSSLEIGPSSGISNAQLKRDSFIINTDAIESPSTPASNTGGLITGGSYLSGDAAGRYSFELVPDVDKDGERASGGRLYSDDPAHYIEFRARDVGSAGNLISIVIVQSVSAVGVSISVSANSIYINVPPTGATGTEIRNAIENVSSPAFNLVNSVSVLTSGAAIFSGSGSGNFLSGGVDPVKSKRVDIGFRCIAPVAESDYNVDPEFNY